MLGNPQGEKGGGGREEEEEERESHTNIVFVILLNGIKSFVFTFLLSPPEAQKKKKITKLLSYNSFGYLILTRVLKKNP